MASWKDIIGTVAKVAPALGTALGGPAGAAVGTAIAAAVGTKADPEEVQRALEADPQAAVKLREIQANLQLAEMAHDTELKKAEIGATAAHMGDINETMRAEIAAKGLYKTGWRAAIGWVIAGSLGLSSIAVSACLVLAVLRAPDMLQELISAMITLFISGAYILGVNINASSKETQTATTGKPPVGGLVEMIGAMRRK